jgi:hypothetical protein
MRFRSPREAGLETSQQSPEEEELRVRLWQRQRLGRLGYDRSAASRMVSAAWEDGEHADLVHRVEDLLARGASLDQAARIVAPIGAVEVDVLFEGGSDAES